MSKRFLFCAGLLLAGFVTQAALRADGPACCKKLKGKLETPVNLKFSETPLRQVLDDLHETYGLNIMPDYFALQQANISLDRPVSVKLGGVSLKTALNVLTRQAGLTWVVRGNVLLITTKEYAKGKLVRDTYQVADLVTPIVTSNTGVAATRNPSATTGWTLKKTQETKKPKKAKVTTEDQLITLITSTIEPNSWQNAGGPGTIDYFALGGLLVVNQTPDVQEQVADLLTALRRFQEQEVAVEVRIVSMSEETFQRLAKKFGVGTKGGPGQRKDNRERMALFDNNPQKFDQGKGACAGREGVVFLNDIQMFLFLETVQGDCRTNVMQMPKVTVFNGQRVPLQVCNTEMYVTGVDVRWNGERVCVMPKSEPISTGVRLSVQPVISADRRYVRMHFKAEISDLHTKSVPLSPVATVINPASVADEGVKPVLCTQFIQVPKLTTLTADKTAVIADGKTMLLDLGSRTCEVRNEKSVPALGSLPLAADLLVTVTGCAEMKPCVAAAKLLNSYARVCEVSYRRETEHVLVMVTPKIIVAEEEEAVCPAGTEEACASPKVAKLMKQYHKACAAGNVEKARKLAIELIAIDPTCFGHDRGVKEPGCENQGRIWPAGPVERVEQLLHSSERSGPITTEPRLLPPNYPRIKGGIEYWKPSEEEPPFRFWPGGFMR